MSAAMGLGCSDDMSYGDDFITQNCSGCHGSGENLAPPVSVEGATETSALGVGAHQAHVTRGLNAGAFDCVACHIKPEFVEQVGHVDPLPAEVTWGALARTGELSPEWRRDEARCANVYCHGATLSGGTHPEPIWNVVDGAQATCTSCHGAPPPAPHVASETCTPCHAGTVLPDGTIDIEGGLHVNGVLDVVRECNACHGGEENAAPPHGLNGEVATAEIGVGAHQAHLRDGELRGALECTACHIVPTAVEDDGHFGAPPAELVFGPLAGMEGATPAWDREAERCANVYCHGATLSGGTNTAPRWTLVNGSEAACGTCHGAPPPAPHSAIEDCNQCHPMTVDASGAIDVAGGHHIDGVVDVIELACNGCHGSEENAAPPMDIAGEMGTGLVTVGAHQVHLRGGALRGPLPCSSCHLVPEQTDAEGHLDASPAELSFDALARTSGRAPSWDRGQARCADVYCHGASLSGGSNTAPEWTVVDGTEAACGTCHGAPPPAPHIQTGACDLCHPTTVRADGRIDIEGGHHIDGVLDVVDMSCGACHGSAESAAPPTDLAGEVETVWVTVGAHQAHLQGGTLSGPIPCDACHVVPSMVGDAGHIGPAPAELTFGVLATTDELTPTWQRDAERCENVYCHGASLTGGSNVAPKWTVVDGTEAACGTCHGAPPPAPHPAFEDCSGCHPDTVLADGRIDVEGGRHINGVVDIAASCGGCHGHDEDGAPPRSLAGFEDTETLEVGAHQIHLSDSMIRAAISCSACHEVPEDVWDEGHLGAAPAELVFSGLATMHGAEPTWDRESGRCANVYCHGSALRGGQHTEPLWTLVDESQRTCSSCHGYPPPAPHVDSWNCGGCHGDTVQANGMIDVEGGRHINGFLDVTEMSCSGCHGSDVNAAPPAAVAGGDDTENVGVGAHQAHLLGGRMSAAISCEACHIVPQSVRDEAHLGRLPAEVTFSAFAGEGGLEPVWDRDSARCADVYCHGASLTGGSNTAPMWTVVDGTEAACGTCHGAPPPAPHPAIDDCNLCHSGTVAPDGSIDVEGGLHIDGRVQATMEGAACDACHGAPPDTGAHRVHYSGAVGDASYGGTGRIGGGLGYTLDCGNCHPMDASHHANGVMNAGGGRAEVDLSPAGAPPGSLRSMNPEGANYVPGDVLERDARGFDYTNGTCGNVYCHSRASLSVPGPVPRPSVDFEFLGYPIVYPDFEINWWRTYESVRWDDGLSCDGCHDFPPRTTAETVAGGAGDSHSWIDDEGWEDLHGFSHGFAPIACAACHYGTVEDPGERSRNDAGWSVYQPVPIVGFAQHVNGRPDVAFTPELVTVRDDHDLTGASFDAETGTCSDVSCHLQETRVTWGAPYRFGNYPECNRCHRM